MEVSQSLEAETQGLAQLTILTKVGPYQGAGT